VPSVPIVPVVPVLAVVLGAVLVANLVGAYPAWRAARLRPGIALRSE
jgi:ABC-type lipoprotein release transport system permease subunit